MAAEQRHHHALMRRIEMLDEDERHPAVWGENAEQLGECFETAGRCANADYGEFVARNRTASDTEAALGNDAP
jgi:hypothetical protein